MKKALKWLFVGALAASLIPIAVDVDESDENEKKTSVKSLLYSVNLTSVPQGEGEPDKTSVSVTFPGLLSDLLARCNRNGEEEVPEELIDELVDKAEKAQEETPNA